LLDAQEATIAPFACSGHEWPAIQLVLNEDVCSGSGDTYLTPRDRDALARLELIAMFNANVMRTVVVGDPSLWAPSAAELVEMVRKTGGDGASRLFELYLERSPGKSPGEVRYTKKPLPEEIPMMRAKAQVRRGFDQTEREQPRC
jgi:hypothetical protein